MIKQGAIIGIGTVLLVIGLGGLALLQTGVIYPPASIGPVSTSEVTPPGPAPENAQAPPPPQAGVEAAPSAQGGQAPGPANLGPPKTIPVPQAGRGERRYPVPDQIEQRPPARKQSAVNKKRGRSARMAEPKSYARKAQSKSYARKSASKSYARKAGSKSYARKAYRASAMKPVVIRFRFDPVRDRELYVARVHSGDKIKVDMRRVGSVDRRVYFTYAGDSNSKRGALVKVGTRYPVSRRAGFYPNERGYYVIEIKIYPGNRWNIKPRSFV